MTNLKNIKPNTRYLKDIKGIIYDKKWLKTASDNLELYYMYRGIEKQGNKRYDVTIIPPKMLGKEFVKTKGHKHSPREIYKVLKGKAIFLIQKTRNKIVEDVFAIKANQNDLIIIPPNYDHITINPINKELQLGNWISKNCKNNYKSIEKMEGACYFYVKSAKNKTAWIKNKNYKKIPKLRFEKPFKK